MREIKFRAFDKYMKCMCDVVKINFRCQHLMLRTKQKEQYETSFEEVELLQCTGLKDKNGVDIYEGDIIKVHDDKSRFNFDIAKAVYNRQYNGFVLASVDFEDDTWDPFRRHFPEEHVEVIGNIYENPELIGENHD